ncbi:MAG: hypothetical protein PHU93_02385 [Candidatus Gracilibacteria bacterium]|nr:hypothetical protein [Candidatus Gracilibacteria bacterium]
MKPFNHRGETLVGIIVGVTIIAIVIGSIAKILSIQYVIEDDYVRNQTLTALQNNATNIVKKLDTSSISENEVFAMYKDSVNRKYLVMTGSNVEIYKYVDRQGTWVSNTGSFNDTIYTQLLTVDKNDSSLLRKQIIKGEIRELIRK